MATVTSIFERATKKKIRFQTENGVLNTEDLWDLPLETLDELGVSLSAKLEREGKVRSFIKPEAKPDTTITLQFKVVKRVIDVRLAEKEAAEKRQATIARKQRIMEIMANKQDEDLASKDLDELQAMLDEM